MEDPVIDLLYESGLFLFLSSSKPVSCSLTHLYGETAGKGKQWSAETEHFCFSMEGKLLYIERNKSS